MSYVVLTVRERGELVDLFFRLRDAGARFPAAQREAMTALRCLKAIHSNAIEDKAVDRIFLQVLLHGAGIPNKFEISQHYANASLELRGQESMLRWLEDTAKEKGRLSISMILEMHRMIFEESIPEMAGRFRQSEVRISGMSHRPPRSDKVSESIHQHLDGINESLFSITSLDEKSFLEVLKISARVHYLIAGLHPFADGNGRVARAVGDYVMLVHGLYYDVIMTDYRHVYLDALEASSWANTDPLYHFLEYSYLETLRRISGFFNLIKKAPATDGPRQ